MRADESKQSEKINLIPMLVNKRNTKKMEEIMEIFHFIKFWFFFYARFKNNHKIENFDEAANRWRMKKWIIQSSIKKLSSFWHESTMFRVKSLGNKKSDWVLFAMSLIKLLLCEHTHTLEAVLCDDDEWGDFSLRHSIDW